jgi:Tfp pilus assembly protein PilF
MRAGARGGFVRFRNAFFLLILFPLTAWAQIPEGQEVLGGLRDMLHTVVTDDWLIRGRTTDMKENPIGGVKVRIDVDIGVGSARVMVTNLQGEFKTEFLLDATKYRRLTVKLVATKPGYTDAHETVEFGSLSEVTGITLVLRRVSENPDLESTETLVNALAPGLRQDAAKASGVKGNRQEKNFVRGCAEFFDRHNAVRAVPLLTKAFERAPSCVECRLLLALAMFQSGSWASASRQLDEALKLNDAAPLKRPEAALIAGKLERWRGKTSEAASFFQNALAIDPDNALALEEMGRILIEQEKWEAALPYLDRALQAGAGDDVRLLRARALLEAGDVPAAKSQMDEYTAHRKLKGSPIEARLLNAQVRERMSLERYADLGSVLTDSPEQLLKTVPELKGIRMAPNQDDLKAILENVGEGVKSFFQNLPNTVSLERVHEERLGREGNVLHSFDQDFQYLLLAKPDKMGVGFVEHRGTLQGASAALHGLDQGLMLTAGFTSVSLLFHPLYQNGASFRYLGHQWVDGKDLHVIAFAQKPQTAQINERFTTRSGTALILVQGVAWIDPTSFQIVRLRTDLLAPQPKIKLRRQTTEIHFAEVSFKGITASLWLPKEVSVTVNLRGHVYHNLHRYSDFMLFNVETKEEIKTGPVAAAPGQQK